MVETLEGTVARAVREVVGALKDNGADISLDVRHGSLGCPPVMVRDDFAIAVNGTIDFDGVPVIFAAGKDKHDSTLRLYMGARVVASVTLALDYAKPNDKWSAAYGSKDIKTEFAAALDLVKHYLGEDGLKRMHFHMSGIAYGPKGEREHLPLSEASAPLKLKKPGAAS